MIWGGADVNSIRNKVHNKYNLFESSRNHPSPSPPPTGSKEKLSSTKRSLVSRAGDHYFTITFPKMYLHIGFTCFITLPKSFCFSFLHLLIFSDLFIFLVTSSGLWDVVPFSSCPQSFPASGSFQMSQLSRPGGQNTGVSASTSVLPYPTINSQ